MKFGTLKTKILQGLVESYNKDHITKWKTNLKEITKNKELKDMYLFYENFEKQHIDDKETAILYVEEISKFLQNKRDIINESINNLTIEDIDAEENEIYASLDQLFENDSLNNIHKKVLAKKKLVNFLMEKKKEEVADVENFTLNENLLLNVLTNDFNLVYDKTLSEDEKNTLKDLLSLSESEMNDKSETLKKEILDKVNEILSESIDNELKNKLKQVQDEVNSMDISRFNYYRLSELQKGLF